MRVSDSAVSERPSVQFFLSLIPPGLRSERLFALLGANFKLSAFSKLADGNHAILAAPFLRLEARDASPAHPRKPQLAWLFLYWVRTLNCPLFLNWQTEITRFWLLSFLDWNRPMPLLPIPGKPQLAWLFLYWVRTLNCPLFESGGIEKPALPRNKKRTGFRPTMSGALKLRVFNTSEYSDSPRLHHYNLLIIIRLQYF